MFYAAIAKENSNWFVDGFRTYKERTVARKKFYEEHPEGNWVNINRRDSSRYIGSGTKIVIHNGCVEKDGYGYYAVCTVACEDELHQDGVVAIFD